MTKQILVAFCLFFCPEWWVMVVQGKRSSHTPFVCFHPAVLVVLRIWNGRKTSV